MKRALHTLTLKRALHTLKRALYTLKRALQTQRSPAHTQKSPSHSQKSPTPTQKSPTPTQKSPTPIQKIPTPTQKIPTHTPNSPLTDIKLCKLFELVLQERRVVLHKIPGRNPSKRALHPLKRSLHPLQTVHLPISSSASSLNSYCKNVVLCSTKFRAVQSSRHISREKKNKSKGEQNRECKNIIWGGKKRKNEPIELQIMCSVPLNYGLCSHLAKLLGKKKRGKY